VIHFSMERGPFKPAMDATLKGSRYTRLV